MADYIYMVQMDIPAELEADFNRIYDTQHVPNIIKASGVESCTRYQLESSDVAGVARFAAVYEIDSPEVPTSPAWVAASDAGDWATMIRPYATNRSHIIYRRLS